MSPISFQPMLDRSTILIERKSIINVSPVCSRESVKSGHHCCPCQAPPPPVLVTTSPSARIIRQSSQPEASACCCSGCCCPLHTATAPSAASLRQLREPGDGIAGIAADSLRINGGIRQFRQVSRRGTPHPSGSILRIRTDRTKEKKRKKKSFRFFKVCGTSSFCTCTASSRPMVSVSYIIIDPSTWIAHPPSPCVHVYHALKRGEKEIRMPNSTFEIVLRKAGIMGPLVRGSEERVL